MLFDYFFIYLYTIGGVNFDRNQLLCLKVIVCCEIREFFYFIDIAWIIFCYEIRPIYYVFNGLRIIACYYISHLFYIINAYIIINKTDIRFFNLVLPLITFSIMGFSFFYNLCSVLALIDHMLLMEDNGYDTSSSSSSSSSNSSNNQNNSPNNSNPDNITAAGGTPSPRNSDTPDNDEVEGQLDGPRVGIETLQPNHELIHISETQRIQQLTVPCRSCAHALNFPLAS